MGETGESEVRVGVICESDLRRHVFTDITCSNAVRMLAFVELNMWMRVSWPLCASKRSWLHLSKFSFIYMM